MKKLLIIILVFICCLFSACSGVSQEKYDALVSQNNMLQSQLAQTPEPTITPSPTPSPTPIPTPEPTLEPTPTPTATLSPEELKALSVSLRDTAIKLDYKKYFRNPDNYPDNFVYFTGEIIQIMDDVDNMFDIRIAVNDNYDTVAYVLFTPVPGEDRFLENDKVKVYASTNGLMTYESTGAGNITIPYFISADIELFKK